MKILAMSDSPVLPTGFARVMRHLIPHFIEKGHEVRIVGWCHTPATPNPFPYPIYSVDVQNDYWGQKPFRQALIQWQPDLIFTLGDPWMILWVTTVPERYNCPWVAYVPIDGYPLPPHWHTLLNSVDKVVSYSKFGQEVLAAAGISSDMIYHGIDLKVFKPFSKEDKKRIRKELNISPDAFIVGCVARNQPRKNIPLLFEAFSIFAKDKSNVYLFPHMSQWDVGWDLIGLAKYYGIPDKVITTSAFYRMVTQGYPDETLVSIYNVFDLFVLLTGGEGFGYPIIEAQACGVPVLVTDFSSCPELVEYDNDSLVRVSRLTCMTRNINQAFADVNDCADKINKYFVNTKFRENKIKEAKNRVKNFAWDNILPQWDKILDEIPDLKKSKPSLPKFLLI